MKDPLFEPIHIHHLEVKNRIYMPAMHMNMADNFFVTQRLVDFYARRAKGGAGMITVGYATIDENSGNPGNIGAHDDAHIEGLKKLAKGIKQNGARAAVQINHAGRYNFSFFLDGKPAVAPSAVASRLTKETPRELSKEEIIEIIENFGKASARIREAGFDAVDVLSGTGYLLSQFLSPITNQREDEYGGEFENRMKFPLDVMRAIHDHAGEDFPIIVRMNGNEFMEGGLTREELKIYAENLEKVGVNALCINVGWHEARVPQITSGVPRGAFAYLSRGIKERVCVPVIASHRINEPDLARELIADDFCDMVALGRSLIADPDLPNKARNGREETIIHCIACAQGCFDHLFQLRPVECLCNPVAGHEADREMKKAEKPLKVLVAGGGPAGMQAAIAAIDRGHDVVLYEKRFRLGGQLPLAAAPPGREEFLELALDLEKQLALRNARVIMNQSVNSEVIEKEKPDHVILATGAVPIEPPIEGSELSHVEQAWDILSGKALAGPRVVVVGGGAVGVETALFLSEKGTITGDALKFLMVNHAEPYETLYEMAVKGTKQVILIEMLGRIGQDIGKSTRWGMLQDVARSNITVKTATRAKEIIPRGIIVLTEKGEEETIEADTIVLGVGATPYNPLEKLVSDKGIPCTVAGDAKQVGKAFEAVHQGFLAGRDI